jgi:CDP-4-dehydro-6-deoxyglucose reductase
MSTFQAKLVGFHDLAPEVRHFVLEVPGNHGFAYTPGQFVSITEPLHGQEITRAYSVASPPNGNRFELCLNRVQEGVFSPHLFQLSPGDTVHVQGPLGYFVPRNPISDSVFIATGTGIAPIRSILEHLLKSDEEHQFTLLFGVRHQAGLLYREEFDALAARHPNFRFWPTLSRPEASWRGRTGHVQRHLSEAIGERRDLDIYVCGLKAMVDDVRSRLKTAGFDRRHIIYEKYD